MLQNRIYVGDIVHKDKHYPGKHDGIIDRDLWGRVQARLSENRVERRPVLPAGIPACSWGCFTTIPPSA